MQTIHAKFTGCLCLAAALFLTEVPLVLAAAPAAPAVQSAAAVHPAAVQRIRLQWEAIPGAVKYRVVLLRGAADTPDNVVWSRSDAFVNGYEIDAAALGADRDGYYWKVCPLNYSGIEIGPYTAPQPLKAAVVNPPAPAPTTEFSQMAYAPLYPVYSWIPFRGAVSYEVRVYRRGSSSRVADKLIRDLTTTDCSLYDDAGYTWGGTYYWQVQAKDADGNALGGWSESWDFQVTSPVKVAALGDSITHGGGVISVPPGYRLYDWETYSEVPVKNLGYSGNTVEAMDERFERDVLPFAPRVLIIMGGVNNYRAGDSAWSIIHMMAVMRDKCNSYGIIPVFATVTPINPDRMARTGTISAPADGWLLQQQRLNDWLRSQPYAVDVTAGLTDSRGWLRADYTTDGLHPDQQGKKLIGEAISRYLLHTFPYMDLLGTAAKKTASPQHLSASKL